MKIKCFECPKSIRNHMKKIMLGTSDARSTIHLSRLTSKPGYYIVYCWILRSSVKIQLHILNVPLKVQTKNNVVER